MEVLEQVRPPEATPPKPKKRKTDIRTLRKLKREKDRLKMRRLRAERNYVQKYDTGLKADFHKLRREYKRRREKKVRENSEASWDWDMTLLEWMEMWASCPAIEVVLGEYKPAWKCRGRRRGAVKLERIDFMKPFSKANVRIVQGKKILYEPREEPPV